MSVWRRTLLAIPVALVAIGLFAATSRPFPLVPLVVGHALTLQLDEEGRAAATAFIEVDAGEAVQGCDLDVLVESETARRSLKVWDANRGEAGEDDAVRVIYGAGFEFQLPEDCLEYDPDALDEATADTDLQVVSDWPELCTVEVPMRFDGKKDTEENVRISGVIDGRCVAVGMALRVEFEQQD